METFNFKNKYVWIGIAGVIVLMALSFFIGTQTQKGKVDGAMKSYNEIVMEIEEKEEKVKELKEKSVEKTEEVASLQSELTEAEDIIDEKNKAVNKIAGLNDELKSKQDEVNALDAQIKEKNDKLSKLTGQVEESGSQPIHLNAGEFYVGSDLPEGRYKATATGRGSNFVVYDETGYPEVNTILGDSVVGTGDYTFTAQDGWMIKTQEAVKLIPLN